MLLYNTVEENLRGMNERMNDTHAGFLILDLNAEMYDVLNQALFY